MANYFGIEFRDNVLLWDEQELLSALESQFPGYEMNMAFYPALAGGGSYFVNSAKVKATGAYIKPLNAKGFDLTIGQTAPLQPQLDELKAGLERALAATLPSSKPKPVKRK